QPLPPFVTQKRIRDDEQGAPAVMLNLVHPFREIVNVALVAGLGMTAIRRRAQRGIRVLASCTHEGLTDREQDRLTVLLRDWLLRLSSLHPQNDRPAHHVRV